MTWAIRAGRVYTPHEVLDDGYVVIDDARITGVGRAGDVSIPPSTPIKDLRPHSVAPGFIDLHVHGAAGYDFMDGDDAACAEICAWHARGGTTALLATTCSAPVRQICDVLDQVRVWQRRPAHGARVLGAHVEGPFFNLQMRGCHLPEHVKNPSIEDVEDLLRYGDVMRHITMAPEIDGALAATERFAAAGSRVAVAHSDATSDDVDAAIGRGLTHVTHLFNAMSYFHRRGPNRISGVAETALVRDALTVEVIADGRHVNPNRLILAVRAKGTSGVCLVTDAMRGAGMPDGLYTFGPRDGAVAVVEGGQAVMPDGTGFASSTVPMIRCVQVMVQQAGVSLRDALVMASRNPARVLGLDHRKGALQAGMDADLVVFDAEQRVRLTVVEGRIVFPAESEAQLGPPAA